MPNNESIPVFEPADRVTGIATATIRGKRFLDVSATPVGGPTGTENIGVAECGAGIRPIGVSCYDAAIGEQVPMHNDHSWVLMPAGAATTAGQEVMSDAQGRPIPLVPGTATNRAAGKACSTQAVVDADVLIKLYS